MIHQLIFFHIIHIKSIYPLALTLDRQKIKLNKTPIHASPIWLTLYINGFRENVRINVGPETLKFGDTGCQKIHKHQLICLSM